MGGDITVQRFAIAQDGGTTGSYTIPAGQTVTSTGTTAVGVNGTGTLDVTAAGATLEADKRSLFDRADAILMVQKPIQDDHAGVHEADMMKEGTVLIGALDALADVDVIRRLADRKITGFSLELVPRITRAQAMDVLSSQATVSGYEATLRAAERVGGAEQVTGQSL